MSVWGLNLQHFSLISNTSSTIPQLTPPLRCVLLVTRGLLRWRSRRVCPTARVGLTTRMTSRTSSPAGLHRRASDATPTGRCTPAAPTTPTTGSGRTRPWIGTGPTAAAIRTDGRWCAHPGIILTSPARDETRTHALPPTTTMPGRRPHREL